MTADARRAVILRHARLYAEGKPMFCMPSKAELEGVTGRKAGPGTDGKVIYPDREAAEAAARELEALGAKPMRSYPCGRSPRRRHHHLTTDHPASRDTTN